MLDEEVPTSIEAPLEHGGGLGMRPGTIDCPPEGLWVMPVLRSGMQHPDSWVLNFVTVEGRAGEIELNALQEAFHEHCGLQCGFCTPGILMSLTELLRDQPDADEEDVRLALSGHLCRCTSYQNIVVAAMAALKARRS